MRSMIMFYLVWGCENNVQTTFQPYDFDLPCMFGIVRVPGEQQTDWTISASDCGYHAFSAL